MTAPEALARATTVQGVRDGVCRWFGGDYDPDARAYVSPQVRHLGAVKRGRAKTPDATELFYLGEPESGALMGSWMWVWADASTESRAATAGAFGGLKLVDTAIVLHVFLRSIAEFSEDAQDAFYDLQEALIARIREDRCMGTGGFEAGGFDVGEHSEPWLRTQMAPVEVVAGVTRGYLAIEFNARYYVEG